jgi:hypothetical protein
VDLVRKITLTIAAQHPNGALGRWDHVAAARGSIGTWGRQVSMRSVAAFALASIAICSSGCATRPEQARRVLSQFREALTLSLVIPSSVVVGEEIPLRFRVQNSGRRPIDACVGLSRNVRIVPDNDTDGNEPIGISAHVVDHPGCQQRFRIAPGAHFEWNETTSVPGIVVGPASLEVDVQIVDPRHCQPSSGCPDTMLTASAPTDIRRG